MHQQKPGMTGIFALASLLATLPFTAACEKKSDTPIKSESVRLPQICDKKAALLIFPHTGRVLTEEYCPGDMFHDGIKTVTQWDFDNLLQLCSGVEKRGGNGIAIALGTCKSIFNDSVRSGEREYLLDTLNIERKKIGLPDLNPQNPVP